MLKQFGLKVFIFPLEKSLASDKFLLPKDALCQVWLRLVQWF